MFKRFAALALFAACMLAAAPAFCAGVETWLCYYGADFGPKEYGRFDLAVFDGVKHPPLEHKARGKPVLLGYVSVGEERQNGPTWVLVQNQPFVAAENKNWNTLILDLRSEKWQNILLDLVIPKVLAQGFDGVFLDTIDSALAQTQGKDKAAHDAMRAAAISFLRKLRERHPGIHIALNRGLELMPEAAPLIDSLLIEDLSFEYDFDKKEYRAVHPSVRNVLVAEARKAQSANPQLTVLTLDYATPDQKANIREAIRYSRSKGFVPYVSTLKLDQVFYHTLAR